MHDWAMPTAGAPSTEARRGDGFLATPFSERCAGLVDVGHHVFLGISSGNGYFSEDRLLALLGWAAARFTRITIAHPDTGTVACTYLGRGYPPRHARARAHRDVRQTANRISRAVATARIDPTRLDVARFSDFYDTPAYRAALERVTRAHREQPAFHATCTRMVTGVLRTTMPAGWTPSAGQLTTGAEYLDRELPFLLDTPGILGVPASVFAYRATPALAGFLYGPDAPLPAAVTQGFVTVEPLPQP
ncbi:cyclo(L-tyrosyl-L-tyrosyl) synthase [Streptomyces sp. SAI-135]|uniref:tRNA-dependent cyclodipeptide synthase n=1 Tax=unclassified Streptomyces TaxID=2593676 RepID=UPI00247622A4|nr:MULTISPECIES: tRNA-dependent cyclodipeptide synthase [unclassified Streptomyces]MDH6521150.1 cyclo(L-tyrosyl-L-tyrosyl) synthase [Streptomyces sp. SAI-090]MDH6572453.1 cyclo(L-tyrosyl-L-tyrosyl) synthase [Streptomyces sp. SAI-117]MDH6582588.1 cyclo(L-tyrosyl-L-tyrosyl) synthase [Streptomyces sp. SAI-133]MDH6614756.1 cyclo(L-tyrosyl-L-tyrosyl) synthase [Streptomyces sp. SAI-135]